MGSEFLILRLGKKSFDLRFKCDILLPPPPVVVGAGGKL